MYISVHLPKTGGSSFLQVLQRVFGDLIFFDYYDRITSDIVREAIESSTYERRLRPMFNKVVVNPAIECIHGHFAAGKYDRVFPDCRRMIWLRDPTERVLSQYHYWGRAGDFTNPVYRDIYRAGYTLENFIQHPGVHNLQTLYADGHAPDAFWYVGITEEYEKGLRLLWRMFELTDELNPIEANVNPEKRVGDAYDAPPVIREWIRDKNRRDEALYEQARTRFDNLCREYGIE